MAVPTVRDTRSLRPSPTVPALILIGQNPGHTEDELDTPFIGPSGNLARTVYTEAPGFLGVASVYYSNTYRCATPRSDDTPKSSWATPCTRAHLAYDLARLSRAHSSVTALLLGACAVRYTHKLLGAGQPSLKQTFTNQGATFSAILYDVPVSLKIFTTYHPAYLIRDNKHVLAVADHLTLLRDYLVGHSPEPVTVTLIPPAPPSQWSPL